METSATMTSGHSLLAVGTRPYFICLAWSTARSAVDVWPSFTGQGATSYAETAIPRRSAPLACAGSLLARAELLAISRTPAPGLASVRGAALMVEAFSSRARCSSSGLGARAPHPCVRYGSHFPRRYGPQ